MTSSEELAATQAVRISAREKAAILKAVADKHGELTAALVVSEANPENAAGVAHRLSQVVGWNRADAEAADLWRQDQARAVIRSVTPELIQLGVIQVAAPYYVRDPRANPGDQGYVPLLSVKSSTEVAQDAVRREIDQAAAALERAYGIAVALEMQDESAMAFAALGALGRSPVAVIAADVAGIGEGASAPSR